MKALPSKESQCDSHLSRRVEKTNTSMCQIYQARSVLHTVPALRNLHSACDCNHSKHVPSMKCELLSVIIERHTAKNRGFSFRGA